MNEHDKQIYNAALADAIAALESIEWSVGNSPAGEIAAEMTMETMREARDLIRDLKK